MMLPATVLHPPATPYFSRAQKFNFDVDRSKGIIHSRIINLPVLRRSWGDVDAFTLQIYRYSQALIDLTSVASPLIRYCVAGLVCMDKQLCGVCSNA